MRRWAASIQYLTRRWYWRNWEEIKIEILSACMAICMLLFIAAVAAMIVEGFSIGR